MRTLFFNGKIYTNKQFYQAMIVDEDKIVAVGGDNDLQEEEIVQVALI